MPETIQLKLRQVVFMPSGRRGTVPQGTSVLDAARTMGVEIESICGGLLTCGKCKIQVEEGDFQKLGIKSAADHVSAASTRECELLAETGDEDFRLSCQSYIEDDVLIFIPEEARGQKQVIRKAASDREITLNPVVRQVYVEIEQAELGEHRGDWGRLQDAIEKSWELTDLTIDLHVLQKLQATIRKGKWAVTVTLWHDKEVIDIRAGYNEGVYGLAVDIGSTTVVGHLCDLRTGEVLSTESTMNPQVKYGEDLMSRVSYAMMHVDGLTKMHKVIIDALNQLAVKAARSAGIRARHINEAVFVGNTTMTHILMGINPIELGGAPFALANRDAVNIKARDLGLRMHPAAWLHILPSQAGHVGADNVGVLIAEEPYRQDETILLVDIGTNAEIVLGNSERMYSASSPTGPAFEGAQIRYGMRAAPGAIERVRIDPKTLQGRFQVIGEARWSDIWGNDPNNSPDVKASGICGSGIIEVIAEMFLKNIVLPDGRFNPALQHERIRWDGRKGEYLLATAEETTTGEPILVTQDDVRNIQLAKAALYAGAKLLMNRANVTAVDKIVLAGAFGSYIDTRYAMILGMIPDCDLNKVIAVGNAAGDGARIALLNKDKRAEAADISQWVTYIETAVDPNFQDEFVGAIHMPHASDAFPHLDGLLPKRELKAEDAAPAEGGRRRRRTRRPAT